MKKFVSKKSILLLATAIILIGLIFYFRPLPLSNLINENEKIVVTHLIVETEDGEISMDSNDYNNITTLQTQEVLELFNNYTYKRKFSTILSDGSFSDLSEQLLYINISDNSKFTNTIVASSGNGISVNSKTYKMHNSEIFIKELLQIINQ